MAGDETKRPRRGKADGTPAAKAAPARRVAPASRRKAAEPAGGRGAAKAAAATKSGAGRKAQPASTAKAAPGVKTSTRRNAEHAATKAKPASAAKTTSTRKAEPGAAAKAKPAAAPKTTARRKAEPAAAAKAKPAAAAKTTARRKAQPGAAAKAKPASAAKTTSTRKAEPVAAAKAKPASAPKTTARRKAEPAAAAKAKAASAAKATARRKAEPVAAAKAKPAAAAKATTRRKAEPAAAAKAKPAAAAMATARRKAEPAAAAKAKPAAAARPAARPKVEPAAAKPATRRTSAAAEQAAATERNAARRAKAQAEQAAAVERKTARRAKAQAEQTAAAERKTARRAKVEAEQTAAVERKTARRAKVEAEQAAAVERKTARRAKAAAETKAAAERKAARTRKAEPAEKKPSRAEVAEKPVRARRPQLRVVTPPPAEPSTPTPVIEGPVEGKGIRTIADPAAVAALVGDAANTEAPLSEVLPPAEPLTSEISASEFVAPALTEAEEAWRVEHENRIREREERRAERMRKQAEKRAERKAARAAAAPPQVEERPRGEVIGTITVRPEGYGFLKRLEGPPGDDIFLPPDELQGVMDGDRLRVRLVRGRYGRDAGQLLEILDRRRRHLVGTFYRRDRTTYVVPVDPTLPRFVPVRARHDIRDGQVVKVGITQYPGDGANLLGDVEKAIGNPGDPIVEVLEVAYSHGFAEDFPADVRDESERIPDHVTDEEKQGRRDITGLRLVTIDGADARDFDDAVYVERREGGGYRLVVAIADVAHYVRPGSRLDEEAVHRATSVYFPNHVLPMLPERLSNGICSLNPRVDRLCMVADVKFDAGGKPESTEIYEGVMWSHARCTYEQVAKLLEGEAVPELDHVKDDLLLAGELAAKLRRQRTERGSLDFDLPEAKPILDDQMNVVEITRRDRNDAHRLIEEFMLAANEAVARFFGHIELPTVYRVHGQPDLTKLQNFVNLAGTLGFFFDLESGVTPVKLGQWLKEIEGSVQQKALNTLLLRSMMQAVYTPENIGHFGLGAEHYLHFTSPIRRYPDLVVHRLLKQHWARDERVPKGAALDTMEDELAEIAAQSSQRERAAMEAEREIDAYFKCLFVQDKVGEIFGATITSITDFGFFAELEEYPVEGLVRAEELGTQWELDDRQHRLVFGGGLSFGIGDRVQVEIAGVDMVKRQIGLVLVADQEGNEVLPIRPRAWRQPGEERGRGPQRFGGARGERSGGGVARGPREERFGGGRERFGGPREARGAERPGGAAPRDRFGGGRDRFGGRDDRRAVEPRGGKRPFEREGGAPHAPRGADLAGAIDRMRRQRGPAPGPGRAAPAGGVEERRGSRFAAGDRSAAWRGGGAKTGPFAPGFVSQGGYVAQADEEGKGGFKGKKKGKKGKSRPGRRERQSHKKR